VLHPNNSVELATTASKSFDFMLMLWLNSAAVNSCGLTTNIGYPKLFNGGAVGRQETPAAPTVNNFVAATSAATWGWPGWFICGYPSIGFPAPAGQVC